MSSTSFASVPILFIFFILYFSFFIFILILILKIAEDTADNTIESQFDGSPSISVDYDLFSGHKLDKKKTETGTATDTDTEAVIKNTDLSDKTSNNDTIKEIKNEAEKLKNETTNIEDKTSEEKNVPDTECSVSKLKYPLGSVVAVVKMIFVAQEEYETTMPGNQTPLSLEISTFLLL